MDRMTKRRVECWAGPLIPQTKQRKEHVVTLNRIWLTIEVEKGVDHHMKLCGGDKDISIYHYIKSVNIHTYIYTYIYIYIYIFFFGWNFGSKLFIFHCNGLTNFDTIVFYTTWTQTLKRGALLVDFPFKGHKRAVSTLIYVMFKHLFVFVLFL